MLESVLDGLVVDSYDVSDEEVHDSDVYGQPEKHSDELRIDLSDSVSVYEEALEELVQVIQPEKSGPCIRDCALYILSDEVHS